MDFNTAQELNMAKASLLNNASKTKGKDGRLSKDDFLQLFMTQMAHQDPTAPLDTSQMMAQLAQLGGMEQLQKMNQGITKQNELQGQILKLNMMNYLGKDVTVRAPSISLKEGTHQALTYRLEENTNEVKIKIINQEGDIVLRQDLGYGKAGQNLLKWDGNNDDGIKVKDGEYQISLYGKKEGGETFPIETYQSEKVQHVEFRQGQPWLQLGTKTIPAKEAFIVKHIEQNASEIKRGNLKEPSDVKKTNLKGPI